jgi:hypothetical protein
MFQLLVFVLLTMIQYNLTKDAASRTHIDKTYIINCRFCDDEVRWIEKNLTSLNIPFERFQAIEFAHDPAQPRKLKPNSNVTLHANTKLNLARARNAVNKEIELSWESVARWQNHLQIYIDIAYGESLEFNGPFMILDSSFHFTPRTNEFLTNLDYLISEVVPKDWEILIIDQYLHTCFNLNDQEGASSSNQLSRLAAFERKSILGKEEKTEAGDRRLTASASHPHVNFVCKVKTSFEILGYVIRNTQVAVKLITLLNKKAPRAATINFLSRLCETKKLKAYFLK